ncbi:hypothetical protein PO242_22735 [Bacteroides ovatus]|jgi:hypothetical protein|nr:hypothetical protein [Bacteroides ovatus]MDC2648949.1 hypothetical protein [Bacteroides ovatus]
MADIQVGRYCSVEELCQKRDLLADTENDLFAGDIAPHTTSEAVTIADKKLKQEKESQTEQAEIEAIVPRHLQVL